MSSRAGSYHAVAIVLHWGIAAALLANILLGLWMSRAIDAPQTQGQAIVVFQWHKSIGLTVLVLSLARLAWRFLDPPPPLPASMASWKRVAARVTHWAFYGLMIGIPLSGWLYVSAQWRHDAPLNIPTLWFGLFEVPHLFGLHDTTAELRARLASVAVVTHRALVLGTVALLVLHIAAALRHQFVERDGVLSRMVPWLAAPAQPATPERRSRRGTLSGRVAAVATVSSAALFMLYATSMTLGPPGATVTPAIAEVLQGMQATTDDRISVWRGDSGDSHIGFAGTHAGRPFEGRFRHWEAAIRFDPEQPEKSRIAVAVETGSATDGVPMHDRTLPQREWFDVAAHPLATFRSLRLSHSHGNRYELAGVLTVKTHAVELAPLSLTVNDDVLRIQGNVEVDRAAVDMGMESDPRGLYVSRTIVIAVDVTARRDPS